MISILFLFSLSSIAQSAEWQPVTGEENLRNFLSGTTLEWEEPGGDNSRGEYRADGTGTLFSWGGAEIPRTWEVKGDDQLCVTARRVTTCSRLEKNTADPALYRSIQVATGRMTEIRMSEDGATATVKGGPGPKTAGKKGGPAAASADELAAQLSNPNSPMATLNFKNKFSGFEGNLPDADNQSSYLLLFQPQLPFPLPNGATIFWRPAVPILVDQPVFKSGQFEGQTGLGDIAFDLAYAPKTGVKGLILAYGIITSLPTASKDLGTGKWTLGPEIIVGKATSKSTFGIFPNHQWDIAGSGNVEINKTTTKLFYTYLPGGGWSVGSGPDIVYNWANEQWTVPLQINTGKTVVFSGKP